MLHRKVIETKIGNAVRSLSVSQIPPSHQSKGNPWRQTHYAHEMITDAEKATLRMLQGFWENLFFLAEMHG